jgi:hypothetical protein
MALLITKTDIASYKDISLFTTDNRIDEYINDSQLQDLCPLLGYDFYFDVMKNISLTEYQFLLNGGDFIVNGNTWTHSGLRAVLSEFAYGRYTYFGGYNDTPNGNTIKTFEFSNPTQNDDRKDIWKECKQRANSYFDVIKVYLDQSDFTVWTDKNTNCGNGTTKKGGFGYTLIK